MEQPKKEGPENPGRREFLKDIGKVGSAAFVGGAVFKDKITGMFEGLDYQTGKVKL